jgi:hypothetical protein
MIARATVDRSNDPHSPGLHHYRGRHRAAGHSHTAQGARVSKTDQKALAALDGADLPDLRAAFINLAIPYDEWESADMLRGYLVRAHIRGQIAGTSITWALGID